MDGRVRTVVSHLWPHSQIKYLQEFTEGYNNVAFDVQLAHPEKHIVVKLIKLKGSERSAKKEASIFRVLQKKYPQYPVPQIIHFDCSKKVIDMAYVITTRFIGNTLRTDYRQVKNKARLFEELGELRGMMHSIRFPRYGNLNERGTLIQTYTSWTRKYQFKIKTLFTKLEQRSYIDKKFIARNKIFWSRMQSALAQETCPCLCQGDTSHSNVIIHGKNGKYHISGLIDFEFAHAGGAVKDMFTSIRNVDRTLKHMHSFLKGYSKWNKLPSNWEKLMWIYQWEGNLTAIKNIPTLAWRNLTPQEAKLRRNSLLKKWTTTVDDILSLPWNNSGKLWRDSVAKLIVNAQY